MTDLGLAAGA